MSRICLAVLHKTLDFSLIETIEKLYVKNFDKIFHLVPLYNPGRDGERENIIPVFENRIQLSGYLAQTIDKIYSDEYDYYAVMSSECLLNPAINSNNIEECFELDSDTCFISDEIKAINIDVLCDTNWAFPSLFNMTYGRNGAEIRGFLPQKAEARRLYTEKAGVQASRLTVEYLDYLQRHIVVGKRHNHPFYFKLKYGSVDIETLTKAYEQKIEPEKSITIYPLVGSFSEFFIIPNNTIKDFAHYCGLFAAGRLHYNAAFATSMCFSANKIKMPKDLKTDMKILNLDRDQAKCLPGLELRRYDYDNIVLLDDNEEEILMAYPALLHNCGFES